MLGLGAFNRKPRGFDYKPRFYDTEKERRDERRREISGIDRETEGTAEYKPGEYLKRSMLARRGYGIEKEKANRSRNSRRIVIGLIVLFTIFLVFFL